MLNKGKHLYFNNQPQLQEFVYTSSESYNIRFVGSQRGNYFCIQFLHERVHEWHGTVSHLSENCPNS
jgi:hypothetical protein